jgi:hypothetical protein
MEHRGEIVEAAIRKSGIPVTTIAKKLGKTRQWLYLLFSNPNVPLDVVLFIGKIIYHDFSEEISALTSISKLEESNNEYSLNSNYWKEKYFTLMEEHHALLKRVSELENRK